MKQLKILRILSDMSLIFALNYYLISFIGEIKLPGITYLILCLVTFAANRIRQDNKNKAYAFAALFLLNLGFVRTMTDIVFMAAAMLYSFYLAFKGLDQTGYYMVIDRFRKGLASFAAIFAIAVLNGNLNIIEDKSIPFMIIFVVTSVMLIRSLRLMQYNQNVDELNKINLRYSALVVGLSFMLSMERVRGAIGALLADAWSYLLKAVVFVLYRGLLAVGYVMKYVLAFIISLIEGKKIKEQLDVQGSPFGIPDNLNTESLMEHISRSWIFDIIMQIVVGIIILLAIYLVVRMLMKNIRDRKEEDEYTETREFIKKDEGGRSPRRWASLLKHRSYAEYIRHYYQKFLKLCLERKIDIKSSDTTLEISGKSRNTFEAGAVEKMRQTYIKVRYGGDAGDKQTAKEIHYYYKQLKNSKRIWR